MTSGEPGVTSPSIDNLIARLRCRGITLWADNGNLRLRAPKGTLSPDLTTELSERKDELLAWLQSSATASEPGAETIAPSGRDAPVPLSFAQQRLWFLNRLQGKDASYNLSSALRLRGKLDVDALERTFVEIERRHEVLRTNFVEHHSGAIQIIAPKPRLALEVVDLRDLRESDRTRRLREWVASEAHYVFDLSADRLLRAVLLRVDNTDYALLITMHHIVSDGWSIGLFINEMSILYQAFTQGAPSPLPELPIQYADFAIWQRQWLTGHVLDTQLNYWRQQLGGVNSDLHLLSDRLPLVKRTSRGGIWTFRFDQALVSRLLEHSRDTEATPFMMALAAYAVLLSRYSGQEDLTVGSPIANRNREEIEPLIGFFVNTLVLRISLKGDLSFRELLTQVRKTTLEAQAHQDMPYEKLVDELQTRRDLERNPFFQVMLIFNSLDDSELVLPGLDISPLQIENQSSLGARSDLDLYISETSEGWNCFFCYSQDLFEEATVQRMAERLHSLLETIARDVKQVVSALTLGETTEAPPFLAVADSTDADRSPLSYHQERLWFIDEFETGNIYDAQPTYHNIPLLLRLCGPVDVQCLKESLNRVVTRHTALRTRIVRENDSLYQTVETHCEVALRVTELATAEQAIEHALAEVCRPFDLSDAPLVRASLTLHGSDEALLAVTVHHIIADRTSIALLASELAACYGSMSTGRTLSLPASPRSYPHYALWQRSLPAPVLESLLFYWKRQLRGPLQVLELPTTRPRAGVHTYTAAGLTFGLGADLTTRVEALSGVRQTSVFAVMLTAFKVLLRRYGRHDEIVVGTSDEARLAGAEHTVGPIANLLVLRDDLSDNPTFSQLLARIADTERQARLHRDIPFDKLVLEINPAKDMSRTALFDVLFVVEEEPAPSFGAGPVSMQVIDTHLGYGKYDLNVLLRKDHDAAGYTGILVYNADYYDAVLIEQMSRHFRTLLQIMVDMPDAAIDAVPLLDADEEHRQRVIWNATDAAYDRHAVLHQLFETQVARYPHRIAVVCGDEQLSYLALDRQSNQLAHALLEQGVTPDTLIGLCLERSLDMVVAMLAVLKAGGAYLNMDPAYPEERLRYMVEDSRIAHLITTSELVHLFPRAIEHGIFLDTDRDCLAKQPDVAPPNRVGPGNLAYCIYTSGSTGQPKGVLLQHDNVVRLMQNDRFSFTFTKNDVWTMFHSYCFDFSVWEMYGALLYGGRLVLVPAHVARDTRAFLGLLKRERVTILNQVPTAFYNLVRELLEAGEKHLAVRDVIFGGETLQPAQLRPWQQLFPNTRLINMYGITEITVHGTFREVSEADLQANISNIGSPIPTTTMYLMGPDLRLLPVGVPGEVFVGGKGLARHYLNRPGLTAERFLPDPYGHEPGARLYRTGDLARYLPDGNIEFLGRLDHQVQIRGYRVELGEIESTLNQMSDIGEAVVIATEDESRRRLVAYIVAKTSLDAAGLRSRLEAILPAYMVPSAFVFLSALPLTPSGKIDRRALPAPERHIETDADDAAPSTPTQELLARIWIDVLQVDRVGAYDNFFELGGHSLLATRVVSRIRDVFEVELPLQYVFEASTLYDLAERIHHTRLEAQPAVPPLQPVPHRSPADPQPLSFAQQRLWFLDRLTGPSPTYNLPTAVHLQGHLNPDALRQALWEITRRHEALRTNFTQVNGNPVQVFTEEAGCPLDIVDLSHLPQDERETEARHQADALAWHPFDLEHDRLIRVGLWRLGEDEHILTVTMHHIVSDGWSVDVFIREFVALYESFDQGAPSSLPALPLQYADYACWQREWLQGDILENQMAWWRQHLAGAPERLSLPTDRPIPPVRQWRGRSQPVRLGPELTRHLQDLSRASGTTLFMTLLSGFGLLLARYSGQDDVVVGTPVANRNRSDIEPLIGFFVNTLALRLKLADSPTVAELLTQVRQTSLEAFDHQDVPFEQLVEELQPARNLNHTPLFQVMFVLRNITDDTVTLPGLTLAPWRQESTVAKFDLTLSMVTTEDDIEGVLEYDTELFDHTTIARFIRHYGQLLREMAAAPSHSVTDLALISPQEQTLLAAWNDTATAYASQQTLHGLFEQHVSRTPDRPAVIFGDEVLSYAALNRRTNQLAHHLRHLGVGPEVRVGICIERSPELVIGLLSILKAGGAYVPLEPSLPQERLAFMLSDTQIPVLIAQQHQLERLPEHDAEVICLDTEWDRIAWARDVNPTPLAVEDYPAYVIYTSGSTGQPKGVTISHTAICNRLFWMQDAYQLSEADRILQKTPFSFDVSVWEFFWPLITGSVLVLAEPGGHQDPIYLANLIAEQHITTMHFVPSMLVACLEAPDLEQCTSLDKVICSGEELPSQLRDRFFERLPHTALHNLYGPTEAAVDVTAWACQPGDIGRSVPIGYPIANTSILILDQHLRPVPVGIPGELHIGGVQLARGYLHRPALTAGRFIPDAFSSVPGARLYKTGDLSRYLPDEDGIGPVEFLGRLDHQVKIRGFRIELGEIESVLLAHHGIADAVVLALDDSRGYSDGLRLAAFLVPRGEETPERERLWQWLQDKLPDYMVPSALVYLDAMPLTSSGKTDRSALARQPLPAVDATDQTVYAAPRTEVEKLLVGIWAQTLGLDQVGIHDPFFNLGGHSLLAIQVISRVRDVLSVEVPLRALFEAPTVAGFAARVSAVQQAALPLIPPIRPAPRSQALPLSFAQQRLWFLDKLEGPSPTYNIPIALRLDGPVNEAALEQALRDVVQRHESLRTTFGEVHGEPCQVILPGTDISLSVLNLTLVPDDAQDEEVARRVTAEAHRPFDLAQDYPLRVSLLRLREASRVLMVTMHHIASDGWSLGPLFRDWSLAYESRLVGESPSYAPLPVQYGDYTLWQRELLGEISDPQSLLSNQLAYWCETLAGLPEEIELPRDRPRPLMSSYEGGVIPFELSGELHARMQRVAQSSGATVFMVLQAAFAALLSRLGAGDDIAIGTPIAGRGKSELEDLVGFFVNTMVLRTDVSGNPSFEELVSRVRESALEAYGHADVPFELVVEALNPERSLSRHPVFQVMLVLQNTPDMAVELPGLSASLEPLEGRLSRFDLTLNLHERLGLSGEALGLVGGLEYATALFDQKTVWQLVARFERLLISALASPDLPLHRLEVLSTQERRQVLEGFNATHHPRPETTLVSLFESQVSRMPEATALGLGEMSLSYGELNARANQLAHHLIGLGVGPETLVGVCLDRSFELVVSVLGVLKAGGAYVPLDPSYPQARLAYMLEDASPSVVITSPGLVESWPSGVRVLELGLVETQGALAQASEANPRDEDRLGALLPQHSAYVIYTSGSTGQPKGVVVSHVGIASLGTSQVERLHITSDARVLQFASLSFDASLWELVMALTSGAALILLGERERSGSLLQEVLIKQGVTHATLPPVVVATLEPSDDLCLGGLVVAGESCSGSLVQAWGSSVRLINAYGPTESTVCATMSEPLSGEAIPLIGSPLFNTQVYVLDDGLEPLPVGVMGELYISGAGLARGYLGRGGLTSARFVANPYGEPGSRIYCTGDLARWREDGTLEFMGRADDQVKLRGYRIELGEIESVLVSQTAVSQAAVMLRDEGPGGPELVAYVVPSMSGEVEVSVLQGALSHQLPSYMVPSAWVTLEVLPLTPNGKLDRNALPDPDWTTTENAYMAPRNLTEKRLADIWTEVLGGHVGVYSNFFDLGGHSILAVRLMAMIKDAFGRHLPLSSLFQNPTVETLAELLRTTRDDDLWSPLVPLQPHGSSTPLFCVPGTGGNVVYFSELARCLRSLGQPLYGLQAVGLDGITPPLQSVEAIAAANLRAMREVYPVGPYCLSGHSFGSLVAFDMARQLHDAGESVAFLAVLDTPAPHLMFPSQTPAPPEPDNADWITEVAELLSNVYGQPVDLEPARLVGKNWDDQLTYLTERLKVAGIMPPGTAMQEMRGIVEVYRTQSRMRYHPDIALPVPIVLLRCREGAMGKNSGADETWGWARLTTQAVFVEEVPGDHISMLAFPQVETLAEHLCARLPSHEHRIGAKTGAHSSRTTGYEN
uniref:Nonribosomal peptide synthase n=1 Tax=Candidatus Entotheonella serta TaxID=1652106 RepID=A0A2P1AMD1_9BACT|nr:nonribosomal peptide synthase [Candidatus Entotheonella serta]